MIGFNGQEEGISYSTLVKILAEVTGFDISNGTSLLFITQVVLPHYCSQFTPQSVPLCVDFLLSQYNFSSADGDRQTARQLLVFLGEFLCCHTFNCSTSLLTHAILQSLGEMNFYTDMWRLITTHANSTSRTFGYVFTSTLLRLAGSGQVLTGSRPQLTISMKCHSYLVLHISLSIKV